MKISNEELAIQLTPENEFHLTAMLKQREGKVKQNWEGMGLVLSEALHYFINKLGIDPVTKHNYILHWFRPEAKRWRMREFSIDQTDYAILEGMYGRKFLINLILNVYFDDKLTTDVDVLKQRVERMEEDLMELRERLREVEHRKGV